MLKVYADVIQFKGSHYDFGLMQGKQLKNSNLLHNRKKQWFSRPTHRFHIDANIYRDLMKTFSPAILEEVIGLQDALEMSFDDAIRYFGGYYLEYVRSGCSIFMTESYMVRNYDNDPLTYEGRFLLYAPSDAGYASIGPTMQITGRTDGLNEKGLAMGYNFINTKQAGDGFLCNMIGRMILENCANVDEAIQFLKDIPHRHSFTYPLVDASGDFVIVEASPREVSIHRDNICTNHFQQLTKENRYRMDDSIRRQKEMKLQQASIDEAFDAFQMMNQTERNIFSTDYGAWSGTLHTAIYYPQSLEVGFALGGDRLPFIFNFAEWLREPKLQVKRINGQLDTNIPFAHMTKL